jgi:hypothetical protein
MENASRPKRRVLRYSFATLLFVMTCVCGYLGGYHSGYTAGDDTWHYGMTYLQIYDVADLVVPTSTSDPIHHGWPDLDSLVDIVDDVGFDQPQNECEIRPFPMNSSLVVTGNGIVHRRIHALLADLRKNAPHS